MSDAPTLTILIATLGQRRDRLARLLRGLMPQVDRAGGRVRVLAFWDVGQFDLAAKRQALVEAAETDYVCHVDDDDTVTEDYVAAILEALESRPDFVGLWMNVHKNGEDHKLAELSLKYDDWHEEPDRYCRDITHENPMRTEIARSVDFRKKDRHQPEDSPWAAKLRASGLLRTQVMIDRVLYHYWWIPTQSTWGEQRRRVLRTGDPNGRRWTPLQVRSPWFSWHPRSVLPRRHHMAELMMVVPSRSRPQNVERLVDAFSATGAFEVCSLRIDVDADDPAFGGYEALVPALPPGARLAVGHRWRPLVWKLNRAARQEQHSYFAMGFMGDDHLPRTQHWAQRYLDDLMDLGTGIVYGDDGYQGENTPTQWAMTTDIVRALGGAMVPAPVDHLYCDDAVRDLGRAAGCIRYLPDVYIEHLHPSARDANGERKVASDPQYERVNSRAQYAKDRPAFRGWLADPGPRGLAAQVRLVRGIEVVRRGGRLPDDAELQP